MLELKFTHKWYAKILDIGGVPYSDDNVTTLLNYCVVNKLSDEFIEYDTKYFEPGKGIAGEAKYFQLKPGPYLVLFLKTATKGWEHLPHYWTTVRTPWSRTKKDCTNCGAASECPAECDRGWLPIIPAKYRNARGKEVRIVYTDNEKPVEVMVTDPNKRSREIAQEITKRQGACNEN